MSSCRRETAPDYSSLSVAEAGKKLKQLEKGMFEAARNLEFEKAASLRDELEALRESLFQSQRDGAALFDETESGAARSR